MRPPGRTQGRVPTSHGRRASTSGPTLRAAQAAPIAMPYPIFPARRHPPNLAKRFEPLLAARAYDFGLRPPELKSGLLAGMSMTEEQGGVVGRANTTAAHT